MKKIYSFTLVLLTLLSCLFFSACGDKYKKLKIDLYSHGGDKLSEVNFLIEPNKDSSREFGVKLKNIDKDDVGQVVVYSIPSELVTVSNYRYDGRTCYVNITPNMSASNAKLVISHLDSGKKKELNLNIEQKATGLNVNTLIDKYVVGIPSDPSVSNIHMVDLSKMINLLPAGSTDNIYFKFVGGQALINIEPIALDLEGFADVCSGFKVSGSAHESVLKVYPVTYMENYTYEDVEAHKKLYENKIIEIHFKKLLDNTNVLLKADDENIDVGKICLIENDKKLNSFKLNLKYKESIDSLKALTETEYLDYYKIDLLSESEVVTAELDAYKNVFVTANSFTEDFENVKIILNPKNAVGDITSIEMPVEVKAVSKPDLITVTRFGEKVDTSKPIDIFDYYGEDGGNALGALFGFTPEAKNGANIFESFTDMQIIIDPTILNSNVVGGVFENVYTNNDFSENLKLSDYDGENVNSKKLSISVYLYTKPLRFYYDEDNKVMKSEKFNANSNIRIKYIEDNSKKEHPTDFSIEVKTINSSTVTYWEEMECASVKLNFNPLEGVTAAVLETGFYTDNPEPTSDEVFPYDNLNPKYIYLDRKNTVNTRYEYNGKHVDGNFIRLKNGTVKGVNDEVISLATFRVEVVPLFNAKNPLTLYSSFEYDCNEMGSSELDYIYDINKDNINFVTLMIKEDTSIGDYEIVISQAGIVKLSVTCRVLETMKIDSLKSDNIIFETNNKAFKNNTGKYSTANYIVASGFKENKSLLVEVDLPKDIKESNSVFEDEFSVVGDYEFNFEIVDEGGGNFTGTYPDGYAKENYFVKNHNLSTSNSAYLGFLKGTYIDGANRYVKLTIDVKMKEVGDITKEPFVNADNPNNTATVSIYFFIYEEITKQSISINETYAQKYPTNYMSAYYKDESKLDLEITLKDKEGNVNEDLWKYVFMQGTNYTSWVIDKATLVNSTLSGNGRKNNLIFKHDSQTGSYTAIIKAYVKQFDNTFELQCIVDVDKPILTEKVIINSPVETDYKGRYYINLKQGESYEINAVNFSNFGEVTHQDVVAKIVDNSGSSLNIDAYFEFDGTNPLKFKVKDVSTEPFKLVVFAKDVLKQDLDSQINGFNNPKQFIMNNFQNPEDNYRHLNAYFVLDIVVSDGSETNPYLIKNAKDFWGIDDNDLAKEAYYCVMNNISANIVADDSIMKPIEGFAGHIKTLDNQIFAIDSVYLNNAMYNLFSDFSGEIQNIKFNVEYNYNFVEENLDRELGVFKTNNGKLLNVGVNVGGEASFKSTDSNTEYWFGGLVGVNYGTIVYDRPMIAVDGSFGENNPINNVNAVVYFGGLVGKNTNAIIGYEKLVGADEIVISSSNIREDTLSAIEIYSKLSGDASAVGGVVGLNTYYDDADDTKDTVGTIRNAFVQAVIHAKDSNNVGGVIGKNNQKTTAWKFNLSGATVSLDDDHYEIIANQSNPDNADFRAVINVKSASKIIANNNVGGIVGLDNYGVYVDCDYQVLNLLNKETSITANENVGGIVGKSTYGKFAFCSVMSYAWKYNQLGVDNSKVITNTADIYGNNYVGGVVGLAYSNVGLTAGDGEKVLSDKVFVISSSVNAYISTEGTNANIGGLISSNIEDPSIDYSIIYNSYFIGKMDGLVQYNGNDLCLDSGKTTIINNVYSLNIIGNTIKSGKVGLINDITPHSLVSLGIDYWWYKTDVNGGYIFVTKDKIGGDDSLPIFDLAPDNITTTVAKAYQKGGLTDTLVLDYYDFSSNSLVGEEVLLRANQDMNRNYDIYKLEETAPGSGVWENKGLINIAVLPKNIGTVVINVSSNRTSVVDVSFDGKLVVNGIGECDLTFSSPLNPNATSTIHVVVDYPVGTEFKISRSLSVEDKDQYVEKDSTEQISVNHSKHYFTVSKGVFEYDTNGDGNTDYYLNYKAKENLNLKVVVDYLGSGIDVANYKDYIQISGKAYENDNKTVKLDTKTPFIISVLKEAEESFNITATPFIEVGSSQIYYDGTNGTINLGNKFKVSTNTGIVDASFSYDEAVVYPNDTVYLKAYLTTDKEYDLIDVKGNFEVLSNDNFKYEKVALTHNKYNIRRKADDKIVGSFILDVYEISGLDKGLQTVSIRIEFSDINIENEEANLEIIYDLNLNRSNPSVVYVILPQRINKIEIKNYYLNNNKELELLNVLKPSKRGEMIIDIVPDNGYYDYLEISDVTGSEEIYFHHVGKDGYPLTNKTDVSSDGKGIKLYYYKDKGEDYSRYHIRTEISSDYSSKPHTIQVRAYTKESLLIGKPYEIIVNVRMLPEVVATYVLPDGSDGKVAGSVEGLQREIKDVYLANGVEAHIRVNTKNSNRMSYNLQSSDPSLLNKYEFVQNVDNHYILKPKASAVVDPGDIGKTIKVTIYAYSDMENGDIDEEYCSIEF